MGGLLRLKLAMMGSRQSTEKREQHRKTHKKKKKKKYSTYLSGMNDGISVTHE